ncbi:11-beta-hydroxysteroid dehydrogenase A-like [Euphorbia lathyris]|uniref:11-beta-hydroxysteroid dehydrogenase A-like n=1 Tax=Euphorbia lathyris TaxID=212925 RepID=UPI0033130BEC
MDLIHTFLNLVAPPITLFSLAHFLSPYNRFKSFLSLFHSIFIEDVSFKVVLITGASSGIGEHLAYEYARKGACLALVARREKSLREVAYVAQELGSPDVLVILADVQNPNDCSRIIQETISHFGRLDHLVNNAGIGLISLFEEATDVTNLRTIMDTNFWGSVYTSYYAVPYLRESRGKMVAVASSALPLPRMSVYNASKAAMMIFFETLRVELGSNVHVLIAIPGFVESEMSKCKVQLPDGRMDVDQDLRDVELSIVPVVTASECAKSIVRSACRGDKYLIEPQWFSSFMTWKAFAPDIVEWCYRVFYLSGPDEPAIEAPSKTLLDLSNPTT